MECCGGGCDGYASPIDDRVARADRDRYAARGPDRTTRLLLEMIEAESEGGATVLDIGGGIGVIDHELLKTVASRAVLVEASPAFVTAAREEARVAGIEDRLEVVAADFARHAGEVAPADIVTLDRVVCCYPDAPALVSASVQRARRLYGLVLPRDRWYVRLAIRLDNLRWRLRRHGYRAHAHAHAGIDGLVVAQGLRLRAEGFTAFWRVALFRRDDQEGDAPSAA
jgi:SAM-dependent methyltransferase